MARTYTAWLANDRVQVALGMVIAVVAVAATIAAAAAVNVVVLEASTVTATVWGWAFGAMTIMFAPKYLGGGLNRLFRYLNALAESSEDVPTDASDTRGAVQLVDVVLTLFVLASTIALAPTIYHFIGLASAEADPFSSLLLQLVVPMLFIGLMISVGISARRGT
jgi:hypothetical protein